MPSDHHPVVADLGYSRAHCAKLREGRLVAREAHGEERRREVRRHMRASTYGYWLHAVTGCMAHGCRFHHIRLQSPPHTVVGCIAYGYSTRHMWLQVARHEEGKQQRSAQREANIKVSKYAEVNM